MNPPSQLHIQVANGFWSRIIGLLGRQRLSANEGLLIPRCRSIHTFGMRFAIDVVWLSQADLVTGVSSNVQPWKMCHGPTDTVSCLELAAGTAKELNLILGQKVV